MSLQFASDSSEADPAINVTALAAQTRTECARKKQENIAVAAGTVSKTPNEKTTSPFNVP